MPYVGYEQVLSVENLYISLKIIQKPFQRETFGINFLWVVKMGSCLRVKSIIYKENLPCPWLPVYKVVTTLNFLTICNISTTQKLGYLMSAAAFRDSWARVISFD